VRYVAPQSPERVRMCFAFKSGVLNLQKTINSRGKCEIVRLLEMIASTCKAKLRERNVGEPKAKLLKVVSTYVCSEDKWRECRGVVTFSNKRKISAC
jgi:hypothetical protein